MISHFFAHLHEEQYSIDFTDYNPNYSLSNEAMIDRAFLEEISHDLTSFNIIMGKTLTGKSLFSICTYFMSQIFESDFYDLDNPPSAGKDLKFSFYIHLSSDLSAHVSCTGSMVCIDGSKPKFLINAISICCSDNINHTYSISSKNDLSKLLMENKSFKALKRYFKNIFVAGFSEPIDFNSETIKINKENNGSLTTFSRIKKSPSHNEKLFKWIGALGFIESNKHNYDCFSVVLIDDIQELDSSLVDDLIYTAKTQKTSNTQVVLTTNTLTNSFATCNFRPDSVFLIDELTPDVFSFRNLTTQTDRELRPAHNLMKIIGSML